MTCGSSWGWRSRWRTWTVKSLGDFGAVSRRSIGWYARKTSWYICNTHIHSYLHRWSTEWNDGHLNVDALKLEVWKNSDMKWIQLIFRWRINLWSLPEIFPKFYRLSHRVRQDRKIWGWNWFFKIWIFLKGVTNWAINMFIGEDNNVYIWKYFCHCSLISKVEFFDIWTLPAFFRNFPLAIISGISCEF